MLFSLLTVTYLLMDRSPLKFNFIETLQSGKLGFRKFSVQILHLQPSKGCKLCHAKIGKIFANYYLKTLQSLENYAVSSMQSVSFWHLSEFSEPTHFSFKTKLIILFYSKAVSVLLPEKHLFMQKNVLLNCFCRLILVQQKQEQCALSMHDIF